VGDVADIDGGVSRGLDGKIVEFADGLGAAVQIDVILELADFGSTAGENEVLRWSRGRALDRGLQAAGGFPSPLIKPDVPN